MADLPSLRVALPLPCRSCGYDLRGQRADGRCPECGADVIASIAARVDPEVATLPPLPRPRTAGASLLALTASMAIAAGAATASFVATSLEHAPPGRWRDIGSRILHGALPDQLAAVAPLAIVAAILAAAALFASVGGAGHRRSLLFFGLGGWIVAACLPSSAPTLAMTGAAASIALIGLGPIVTELGRRSRTYRERPAGRQAIGPVLTAVAFGVLSITAAMGVERQWGHDAATPFRLAAAACLAMTMVGFLYLVLNAMWIWSALRSWQPVLSAVVDRPQAPVAAPDPRDEPG